MPAAKYLGPISADERVPLNSFSFMPGTIFIVLLILKLTALIDWSWWWVTCPLWFIPALVLVVAIPSAIFGYGSNGSVAGVKGSFKKTKR